MESKKGHWVFIRLFLILLCGLSAHFVVTPSHPDFMEPAPWYFPLVLAGFMILGVPFVLASQTLSRRGYEKFLFPSWYLPPFSFKQPLVSFDMTSYCFIGYSIGGAIEGLSKTPNDWSWEIPLSLGIGVWIGVRVFAFMYRERTR